MPEKIETFIGSLGEPNPNLSVRLTGLEVNLLRQVGEHYITIRVDAKGLATLRGVDVCGLCGGHHDKIKKETQFSSKICFTSVGIQKICRYSIMKDLLMRLNGL
jgi:hypothetical protein